MPPVMKKDEVIAEFGGVRKLADALGITREAIYQWPAVVPRLRQYEIREILAARTHVEQPEKRAA